MPRRPVARALTALVALVSTGVLPGLVATPAATAAPPATAAAVDPSVVDIEKTNSRDGEPLRPGDAFTYSLVIRCSGLRVDCVNQTVTDVLPAGLDVTSVPQGVPGRYDVEYAAGTRTLTIVFDEPLQEPVDELGLKSGSTVTVDIGMRLPVGTSVPDGTTITNTATTVADNAPEDSSSSDVVVDVPVEVRPVATKAWEDGSAVAQSDEGSTLTLGVRNNSSSSTVVEQLRLTEADPDTFESFDLTGVELTRWPAGADRARLLVCTDPGSACEFPADYTAGPDTTALGALALPGGTTADAVTGFVVAFENAVGDPLPFDATGGTVAAGLQLRDASRTSGAPIRPTTRTTVTNCVVPAVVQAGGAVTSGAEACDTFDIQPDIVNMTIRKQFAPDTDGDFSLGESGEYAVIGRGSPVSAVVSAQNKAAFPLGVIRIVEPAPAASEFDKLDVTKVRLRLPSGATAAELRVEYADGSAPLVATYGANQTADVARPGTRPSRIEVVYTGTDGRGQGTIAVDATAYLDLHGNLNSGVTADDLSTAGSPSPGVDNCAEVEGHVGTSNGTGSYGGTACATLAVEAERVSGQGQKTRSQSQLPPDQPVQFTLTLTNNGNVPLVDPVLYDPPVDNADRPRTDVPNPFDVVRIVSASVRDNGGRPVTLEVFDPTVDAWVAYAASDAALLERATGIRARAGGELAPNRRIIVDLSVQRRAGIADGVTLDNCFATAADNWSSGSPACAPTVRTGPSAAGAVINKAINPGQLTKPIVGLPPQKAEVRLRIANAGNLSASRLQLTDDRAEFYDAVDLDADAVRTIQFPLGANRVQVDALVDGTWHPGTPRAQAAAGTPYALPGGVDPDRVSGLRFTFTHSSGGYELRPCEPTNPDPQPPLSCSGVVSFDVEPRVNLRSDPVVPIPEVISNRVAGSYETRLTPGEPQPVAPATADLRFVEGSPRLDVEKTPDSAIAPGQTAPFTLRVTNVGTTDLTGVAVRDLLPPGLVFDESFANGAGFRVVGAVVPDGAAPVPTPTFEAVTDGERISGLRWDFGDWAMAPGSRFDIEVQVRLAPGVSDGQVHQNLMGATSATPGTACAAGDGVQNGDGSLGAGTWCTDVAAVSTKAGAAFDARKWVAGRDALGWWNDRSDQVVPVGDASCPSRTESGRTYTAFPCVALVNPGDRFDYLMRLVNAGTEPATDMRIIDRFPVQGDKGVVLGNIDRGTQWQNRPTLATAPALDGPGTMTVSYADSEADLCTADLAMGSNCAAGTWDGSFGPQAVGMQLRLAWGSQTPLPPGGAVSIRFSMTTPLDVPRVADPTIAWNSFGHAERTLRAGGISRVLPPTEPIQVGVATAYGSLEVTKQVGDNTGGLPLDDRVFTIAYQCTIDPIGGTADTVVADGTLELGDGDTGTVDGIPAGAECAVWEPDALGGVTSHPTSDPAIRVIEPQLSADARPQEVTVTNSYPLVPLAVEKALAGPAARYGDQAAFTVEITCTWQGQTVTGFPRSVTLVGEQSTTVDAPVGAVCTAVETDDGGATSSAVTPAAGVTVTGRPDQAALEVTNTFEQGHLRVRKELDGAGTSLPTGPFAFEVSCTFEGSPIPTETVTIARSGQDTVLEGEVTTLLPVGAECTVTETDSGGADTTPPPVTVTIVENAEGNTVTATFVNEFSAGTVSLGKELAGAGAGEDFAVDAVFSVLVTCAVGSPTNVVFSDEVEIRGGEVIDLEVAGAPVLLPLGSRCWADETDSGGATSHDIDADSFATGLEVASGTPDELQQLRLEVVNTFDLADYTVRKVVDGEAAAFGDDTEFVVEVSCVLRQGAAATPLLVAERFTISGDRPVQVDGLPVGAECWVVETEDGGATRTVVEHPDRAGAAVVGADGTTRTTVTNTFDRGRLVIRKTLSGAGAGLAEGPFTFEVACTFQGEELPVETVVLERDGESRSLEVELDTVLPVGAECTVTETDDGGADTTPPPVSLQLVENDDANTVPASFVNHFSGGSLVVSKDLAGGGAAAPYATGAVFVVAVTCAVDGPDDVVFTGELEIRGGQSVPVTRPGGAPLVLPLGTRCWAEETSTGGATSVEIAADSYEDAVSVDAGTPDDLQELVIEVTNVFDVASYTVDKTVVGDAAPYAADRRFRVAVTCVLPQDGTMTPLLTEEARTLTDDEPVVIDDLPVGAECWVVETDDGGATDSAVEHGGPEAPAVVAADGTTTTTVTNAFDAGELVVGKEVVDGPAGPYSFRLRCTTDQGRVHLAAGDVSFRLRAGETRTISVPLGARCEVEETDVPRRATVSFEDSDRADDGTVVVDPAAEVTVVNTFPDEGGDGEDDPDGDESPDGDTDGGDLPDTGGFSLGWLLLGVGLVVGGALLAGFGRRRGAVLR